MEDLQAPLGSPLADVVEQDLERRVRRQLRVDTRQIRVEKWSMLEREERGCGRALPPRHEQAGILADNCTELLDPRVVDHVLRTAATTLHRLPVQLHEDSDVAPLAVFLGDEAQIA